MKSAVERAIGSLLNLVFPSTCVHCGADGRLLCDKCIGTAQALDKNVCRRCALPMSRPSTCSRCADNRPASDRMIAAYQMDGPIRSAVHALKYEGLKAIAPTLGALLSQVDALERLEADVIVPVPLHPRRLRERGFNQAELLAGPVAAERGFHLETRLLRRTRNTAPQVETAGEQGRPASMRGAFEATRNLDSEHVLLVDDVVTTTSTVNSAAAALKSGGASRVTVLALAREL